MGLFSPKVPNTISDKKYAKLQASARKQEMREGGLFGKKPTARRIAHGKVLKAAKKGRN